MTGYCLATILFAACSAWCERNCVTGRPSSFAAMTMISLSSGSSHTSDALRPAARCEAVEDGLDFADIADIADSKKPAAPFGLPVECGPGRRRDSSAPENFVEPPHLLGGQIDDGWRVGDSLAEVTVAVMRDTTPWAVDRLGRSLSRLLDLRDHARGQIVGFFFGHHGQPQKETPSVANAGRQNLPAVVQAIRVLQPDRRLAASSGSLTRHTQYIVRYSGSQQENRNYFGFFGAEVRP